MTRVLMLSTDPLLCDPESDVSGRIRAYAAEVGEIDAVVLSADTDLQQRAEGVLNVYPTRSRARWRSGIDAFFLVRKLPKPDVVTAQDPFETGLLGYLISKLLHIPLHVQVHTDFLAPAFAAHSWKNRVRVMLAGFVLKRAARIRVVAPRIKEGIEKQYHPDAPVSVLPIFVDTDRFRAIAHHRHAQFDVSLLFVGRLEAEKRADIAIRALSRVRALGVNAGLTVVGDGSLRGQLQEFAQRQGMAEWVEFVGRQDPLPHYAHADILLVPSTYEGYGMVIVEALAAGVSVLATDVGIAREAGAVIAPFESDGFAGALCALFAHDELPRGRLKEYPYRSFGEYVAAWVEDMRVAVGVGK